MVEVRTLENASSQLLESWILSESLKHLGSVTTVVLVGWIITIITFITIRITHHLATHEGFRAGHCSSCNHAGHQEVKGTIWIPHCYLKRSTAIFCRLS